MILVTSGAPAPGTALLRVTAPAGSTVSIEKDGCLRTRSARGGHVLAEKPGLAEYYFSVFPAQFGVWTVRARMGEKRSEKSVTLSSSSAYAVSLSYERFLFRSGAGFAEGVGVLPLFTQNGYLCSAESIRWCDTGSVGLGNQLHLTPKLDLTDCDTLYVEMQMEGRYSEYQSVTLGVGDDVADGENSPGSFVRQRGGLYSEERLIYTLDLSDLSGSYYIKMAAYGVAGSIYNIWLGA